MNQQSKPIASLLAEARSKAGYTMSDVAFLCELSTSFISDLENGRRKVPRLQVKRLAETYQLDEDHLYYLAGYFPPDITKARLPESAMRKTFGQLRSLKVVPA